MRENRLLVIHFLMLLLSVNSFAAGITFTFANTQLTGSRPKYFEFDVMVAADASGTKIGDTQVYINYNTDGFGENIASGNFITMIKGSFINNINYRLPIVTDNSASRVSFLTEFQGLSPDDGSDLPAVPTQLLHVSIRIRDETKTAGLSFQPDLMQGSQFQSDLTRYDPVYANDTNNQSLPVGDAVKQGFEKFILYSFYPNPFNLETHIEYTLPARSRVKLLVYNLRGQQVRKLLDESQEAGFKKVTWNGCDDAGRVVGSGIYITRLVAGKHHFVRKVSLLK